MDAGKIQNLKDWVEKAPGPQVTASKELKRTKILAVGISELIALAGLTIAL